MQQTYEYLQAQFDDGVHAVATVDEDQNWAVSSKREQQS